MSVLETASELKIDVISKDDLLRILEMTSEGLPLNALRQPQHQPHSSSRSGLVGHDGRRRPSRSLLSEMAAAATPDVAVRRRGLAGEEAMACWSNRFSLFVPSAVYTRLYQVGGLYRPVQGAGARV